MTSFSPFLAWVTEDNLDINRHPSPRGQDCGKWLQVTAIFQFYLHVFAAICKQNISSVSYHDRTTGLKHIFLPSFRVLWLFWHQTKSVTSIILINSWYNFNIRLINGNHSLSIHWSKSLLLSEIHTIRHIKRSVMRKISQILKSSFNYVREKSSDKLGHIFVGCWSSACI